jgi:hypothetical protein
MKTKTFVLLMTCCLLGLLFGIYLVMFHPYTIECRLKTGKTIKVRYYLGEDSKILTGLQMGDSVELKKLYRDESEYAVVAGHAIKATVTKVPEWWDR